MSELDSGADERPWIRVPPTPRIIAALLPVIALGGLFGSLVLPDGLSDFPRALVWALVAAIFGVATGWLLAVLLLPTEQDLASRAAEDEPEREDSDD